MLSMDVSNVLARLFMFSKYGNDVAAVACAALTTYSRRPLKGLLLTCFVSEKCP